MADYIYLIFLILLELCLILQLYYTIVVHKKLVDYKVTEENVGHNPPVSVIVCARNEEYNLEKNLPLLLEQNYGQFEVVVVNDYSNDNTEHILRDFSQKYQHLKVVNIAEHIRLKHGKKFAVTMGIKASTYNHLLFTDADCMPVSNNWISLMARNFFGSNEIILGYSPYIKLPGFLNKLIRFETFFTALNYFSFALAGQPYMGVGRNMAYKKDLFFKGKGFASHMHIPSGDDDLFVNQNATFKNTQIELHPDSHVLSDPKTTFSSYLNQKNRHMGANKAYKAEHKRMLSLQAGSAILFYISLIVLISLKAQWWLLAGSYLLRMLALYIIYIPIFKKLNYRDLIIWLPFFDLIYYFYILVLNIIGMFKKKVQWK